MRINKFVARATGVGRRQADEFIAKGQVSLNGRPASMGERVNKTDAVTLRGAVLKLSGKSTYLVLNKPVGYVCSRRRQGETPTIYELLPARYRSLKPVGRLDKDSSGLLLLTDDGDFAHRMTHPSFHKIKIYKVELDKPLEPLHQQMISDYGVALEDGISQFLIEKIETTSAGSSSARNSAFPAGQDMSSKRVTASGAAPSDLRSESKAGAYDGSGEKTIYQITMHEGRNRQIRRTFAALGYTVTRLHRTSFGNYSLGGMKDGSLFEIISI